MNTRGCHQLRHILSIAEQADAVSQIGCRGPREQPIPVGLVLRRHPAIDSSDDVEAHVNAAASQQGDRFEQEIDAFAWDHLADANDPSAIARSEVW